MQVRGSLGSFAQALRRQIKRDGLLAPLFQSEPNACTVGRGGKMLLAFAAHVGLHILLPRATGAVRGEEAKGRVLRTDGHGVRTGKQMHNSRERAVEVAPWPFAIVIPNANVLLDGPRVSATGV